MMSSIVLYAWSLAGETGLWSLKALSTLDQRDSSALEIRTCSIMHGTAEIGLASESKN
jgi:hypothetical protein